MSVAPLPNKFAPLIFVGDPFERNFDCGSATQTKLTKSTEKKRCFFVVV